MSLKHRHENGALSALASHVTIFVGAQSAELLIRRISRRLRKALSVGWSRSPRCHGESQARLVGDGRDQRGRISVAQRGFGGTVIMGSAEVDQRELVQGRDAVSPKTTKTTPPPHHPHTAPPTHTRPLVLYCCLSREKKILCCWIFKDEAPR